MCGSSLLDMVMKVYMTYTLLLFSSCSGLIFVSGIFVQFAFRHLSLSFWARRNESLNDGGFFRVRGRKMDIDW